MITPWQAENPENAVAFDCKNIIGLHHLAFTVDDDNVLDNLHTRLQSTLNVTSAFGSTIFGMPGGIRIGFIASTA